MADPIDLDDLLAARAIVKAVERVVFQGLTAHLEPPHLIPSEPLRLAIVALRNALRRGFGSVCHGCGLVDPTPTGSGYCGSCENEDDGC